MNFEKAYENYANGTATDEEKEYVESEIAKARALNSIIDEIDAKKAIAPSNIEDVKKAKKKHNLNSIIKMVAIALCCIIVVCGVVCAVVFGQAVSSAKTNTVVTQTEAMTIAQEYVNTYYNTTNAIATEVERELTVQSGLKHSYYSYYVEVELRDGRDIDIVVNGKTGVASLDIYDD